MASDSQPDSATTLPKGIGKPATRALAAVGVTRLDQITHFTESQLLAMHGVGPKAVGVIQAALASQGQAFKPT